MYDDCGKHHYLFEDRRSAARLTEVTMSPAMARSDCSMALLRRLTQRRAYREYYPELSLADRSHGRRSPWRRRPRPWVGTGRLLAVLLITAVGSGVPALATFQSPDQRLIALGDVLTGGIFLLALVAGILEVVLGLVE